MSSPNECPTIGCSTSINVGPPVTRKFRTGSYLIYDDHTGPNKQCGPTNLRLGTALSDTPFRASGSHQLNVGRLKTALKSVAPTGGQLYLVDLREETHLYFDDWAVSWYADKDFANVGQPVEWIHAEEKARIGVITAVPQTKVFCITPEDKNTGNVTPIAFSEVAVKLALTEEGVASTLTVRPKYIRIPVTDHCRPSEEALNRFVDLCKSLNDGDWLHCHCHGGDGRTTTFLALFDMVHWAKTKGTSNFPSLDDFANRQCKIFSYCLNPDGCSNESSCRSGISTTDDWKYYLALERWLFLEEVQTWLANGGLSSGKPFRLPEDWEQRIQSAACQ